MYPPDGRPTAPPGAAPTWLDQFAAGMGFPAPQFVVQEIQRLNNHLDFLAPHIQTIAEALPDVQDLTNALKEASNTGKSLLTKLK